MRQLWHRQICVLDTHIYIYGRIHTHTDTHTAQLEAVKVADTLERGPLHCLPLPVTSLLHIICPTAVNNSSNAEIRCRLVY